MKKIIIALSLLICFACSSDDITYEIDQSTSSENLLADISSQEIIHIPSRGGGNIPLYKNGIYYQLGDLMFTLDQVKKMQLSEEQKGVTLTELAKTWPDLKVYYTIQRDMFNERRVKFAMERIQNVISCIQFIPYRCINGNCNSNSYIEFGSISGTNSSSNLGRIGGKQEINISDGASIGTVVHEIGHALGLYHEHVRSDRNNFVQFFPQNVDTSGPFDELAQFEIPLIQDFYNTTFNFNSVMMYGPNFFALPNTNTLLDINGNTFNIQRNNFDNSDIEAILEFHDLSVSNNFDAPDVEPSNILVDSEATPDTQYFVHEFFANFKENGNPLVLQEPITLNYTITEDVSNTQAGNITNIYNHTIVLQPGQSTYSLGEVVTIDNYYDLGEPDGPQYNRWLTIDSFCGEYNLQ